MALKRNYEHWTPEQILALAPDAKSAQNGQGLARLSKWQGLGQNQDAVWGECKGSGSKPYQTQIDLGETAFKCSCSSRKFQNCYKKIRIRDRSSLAEGSKRPIDFCKDSMKLSYWNIY